MDKRVMKLRKWFDKADAEALVEAGVDTPRKIRAASSSGIEKALGVSKSKAGKIKDQLSEKRDKAKGRIIE